MSWDLRRKGRSLGTFTRLDVALRALWDAAFSDEATYELVDGSQVAALNVDAQSRAVLRARVREPGFTRAAAALHAQHLEGVDASLALAIPISLPAVPAQWMGVLADALGLPEGVKIGAEGWWRGEATGPRVVLTCGAFIGGSSYESATQSWYVTVRDAGCAYEVELEDVEWAGWYARRRCDVSATARVLSDALEAAGLQVEGG